MLLVKGPSGNGDRCKHYRELMLQWDGAIDENSLELKLQEVNTGLIRVIVLWIVVDKYTYTKRALVKLGRKNK